MAKRFEEARAAQQIRFYTADEGVGITVQNLMFLKRFTTRDLARALGVTGATAGKRMRGELGWTVADLLAAGKLLGVNPSELLPRRVLDTEMGEAMGAGYMPAMLMDAAKYTARDSNPEPAD